tara:strand:+ start:322 stop:870 length:549 start_codon:yes stop_codon:yes gene_type:complete
MDLIQLFDKTTLNLINISSSYTPDPGSINVDIHNWYLKKDYFNNYHITFWDTTKIVNMLGLFQGRRLGQFNSLLLWNTRNVTNMSKLFNLRFEYNQPIHFITDQVEDMSFCFRCCKKFNQPIKFNTKNVKNMNFMFDECQSFEQDIEHVKPEHDNIFRMFNNCKTQPQWYLDYQNKLNDEDM